MMMMMAEDPNVGDLVVLYDRTTGERTSNSPSIFLGKVVAANDHYRYALFDQALWFTGVYRHLLLIDLFEVNVISAPVAELVNAVSSKDA